MLTTTIVLMVMPTLMLMLIMMIIIEVFVKDDISVAPMTIIITIYTYASLKQFIIFLKKFRNVRVFVNYLTFCPSL